MPVYELNVILYSKDKVDGIILKRTGKLQHFTWYTFIRYFLVCGDIGSVFTGTQLTIPQCTY